MAAARVLCRRLSQLTVSQFDSVSYYVFDDSLLTGMLQVAIGSCLPLRVSALHPFYLPKGCKIDERTSLVAGVFK